MIGQDPRIKLFIRKYQNIHQNAAATVAARLVDGLGFRYYWATEGLTA